MQKFKALPILAGAAALGAIALMGPVAHADAISGMLTVGNANLATQGSGPYASYTITGITASGTGFTEFEVTASGLHSFVFGDSSVFDLNLSTAAGTGTLCLNNSQMGCTTGAPTPSDLTQNTGTHQVDSFGMFNFVLDDGNGFSANPPVSSLQFDFTTADAVTAANLLTGTGTGGTGASVAAHMALSTNQGCTGFAANGGAAGGGGPPDASCTAVPAPLVGHGLFALLAIGGVLFGGRLLEGLKKRNLHAA